MKVNNEYFDLYVEVFSGKGHKVRDYLSKKFPDSFDPKSCYNDPFLDRFSFREKMVKIYSWAVTDAKAIDEMVETVQSRGVVEIGAGRGYWASLLTSCGVDIVAYDSGEDGNIGFYHPVKKGGSEMACVSKDRALFLCWPPYDTSMAYDCVCQYKGDTLIYIGESYGGCTADDKFFDFVSKNFKLYSRVYMAQWEGLHDNLYIYMR